MTIQGPVCLPYYATTNQKAPEPSNALMDSYGQTFVCAQTGRLWIGGAANNSNAPQIRQVLPWVRNAAGTVGTKVTNAAGQMKFSSDVGAGSVNMMDVLTVDNVGVSYLNGVLFGNSNTGYVEGTGWKNYTLEDSDEAIGTNSADPTGLYIFQAQSYNGTWVKAMPSGIHMFVANLSFYHANTYQVTAAIEHVDLSNGNFYPLHVCEIESRGGFMQMGFNCTGTFFGNQGFRIRAYANVSGVVHSPFWTSGWPTQNPPVGFATDHYRSRIHSFQQE